MSFGPGAAGAGAMNKGVFFSATGVHLNSRISEAALARKAVARPPRPESTAVTAPVLARSESLTRVHPGAHHGPALLVNPASALFESPAGWDSLYEASAATPPALCSHSPALPSPHAASVHAQAQAQAQAQALAWPVQAAQQPVAQHYGPMPSPAQHHAPALPHHYAAQQSQQPHHSQSQQSRFVAPAPMLLPAQLSHPHAALMAPASHWQRSQMQLAQPSSSWFAHNAMLPQSATMSLAAQQQQQQQQYHQLQQHARVMQLPAPAVAKAAAPVVAPHASVTANATAPEAATTAELRVRTSTEDGFCTVCD